MFNADMPTENYKLSKYLIKTSRSAPCVPLTLSAQLFRLSIFVPFLGKADVKIFCSKAWKILHHLRRGVVFLSDK